MLAAVALVVLNAHALTQDPARPTASALAMADGRFTYVGNDEAAARRAAGPGAQVIDAAGLTTVPGFNDAHAHFGLSLTLGGEGGVDLPELPKRKFIEQVKRASAAHPGDGFLFVKTRRLPSGIATAADLDFVARPLFVVSSRGGLLNRRGRERSKLSAEEAPSGFVRGRELAAALDRLVKGLALGRLEAGARAFLSELAKGGITSVQLIDELPDLFEGLRRKDALTARVRMIPLGYRFETRLYQPDWTATAPEWVRVSGVKYFHDDGARLTRHELADLFAENLKAKRPVVVHVLSGHALDTLLDEVESLARAAGHPEATAQYRIEHADEVSPEQAARLKRLGMIVCSNPSMIPEWQTRSAFPLHTLTAAGVRTCIGTDWVGAHEPKRSLRPLDSIELAVTHGGFGTQERITVDEALEAYTVGSAAAEGLSGQKGALATGQLADLVVLSSDPRKVPPESIHEIEVLLTIVGGRIVHRAPELERLTRHAPASIAAPAAATPSSIGPASKN